MIQIQTRRNQHLAVFGLGASGTASARALAASGAVIEAWDDNADQRRRAADQGVSLGNLYETDLAAMDALVLAPGIPLTHDPHPLVDRARACGRPIIGDIELLVEACPDAHFIGITGTNGKSTTTALIGHILQETGHPAQIGGNLGPPALAFDMPASDGLFVLELSSYQLDLTSAATFDVAVLLNISPDHLDRHGGMSGYIAAKRRIFRDRTQGGRQQIAIIGIDDDQGRAVRDEIAGRETWRVISVSATGQPGADVYVRDGALYDATGEAPKLVCDLSGITTLTGAHNWQNAAAAYAAVEALSVAPDPVAVAVALSSYPGLPHRMEQVATIGRVRYINDSKATNIDAAARALASYDTIYWIAGGLAKEKGLDGLKPWMPHIRHAFLIGEAQDDFASALDGAVPATKSGDLASALRDAHAMAQREAADNAVVLLSPACASFDQWVNFEARGDAFRTLARKLPKEMIS
ncbi:MAG: UDP-N-acetylmuramoyl-L-alanine--D-glutamate ligase [Rhodospirillaceae bacterium]|nr:UDP-N-acetylmuramoyl-L-alanine--D-glutamate ligase [Rhodospirillaceae bacterium]